MADAGTVLIGCIWVQYGSTALMNAAVKGHSDVCDQLLKANANPDLKDDVSAREMAEQRLMWALC